MCMVCNVTVNSPIVDGRGGSKPDMAMAGGSNQAKIQELLDAVAVIVI